MFFFFAGEVKCSVLLEPMSLMSYRATETLLNVTNMRLRVIGAEKFLNGERRMPLEKEHIS